MTYGANIFHIPDLRVGTLDSLLALTDDLTKANSVVEGVTHKLKRQIDELERVAIGDSSTLAVDGVPIDSYGTKGVGHTTNILFRLSFILLQEGSSWTLEKLGPVGCKFSWDEVKYSTMTPSREVVNAIQDSAAKLDLDDLNVCKVYNPPPLCFTVLKRAEHDNVRVRVEEYSNVKTLLSTTLRKQEQLGTVLGSQVQSVQFCFNPQANCLPKEELDTSSSAASSSNKDTSAAAAALTTTDSFETTDSAGLEAMAAAAATERQQGWWHWAVAIVPCFSCYHSFPPCALAMERAYCMQQQMIMTKIDSCEVGFMGGM
ncbi:unnamed protein product [Sphagnum balticum]